MANIEKDLDVENGKLHHEDTLDIAECGGSEIINNGHLSHKLDSNLMECLPGELESNVLTCVLASNYLTCVPSELEPNVLVAPPIELEPNYLSYVPGELWVEILLFCDLASYRTLSRISKELFLLAFSPAIWALYLDTHLTVVKYPDGGHVHKLEGIKWGPAKILSPRGTYTGFYHEGKATWTYRENNGARTKKSFIDLFLKEDQPLLPSTKLLLIKLRHSLE